MTQETIVAAFDTEAHAQAAARDLEAAGVPASDISRHPDSTAGQSRTTTMASQAAPAHKEPGFWGRLFGADDQAYTQDATYTQDRTVYDRTLDTGGSVISIRIANVEQDGDRIMQILERHNPLDIDERAVSYGATTPSAGYAAPRADYETPRTGAMTGNDETIQLAEEQMQVGKRLVNRGTTRIRRYVVETPVEENVSLHSESVSVERRPVSGTGTVGQDAFTDKTIEVNEMSEEAVVGKSARITEEVVVHRDVSDRTETVRDTVRKEQVEVQKTDDAGNRDAGLGAQRPVRR